MDKMRDFLKSWPGRILLVMCLVPMAFLTGNSLFGTAGLNQGQVARVGENTIEATTLQNEVTSMRAELHKQVDSSLINDEALKQQVLDNLINRALLESQAAVLGMRISDDAITALLAADPAFADDNGNFSNDIFSQYLTQRKITKDVLFANYRNQINVLQLTNGILATAIYTSPQISRLLDLQLESRPVWVKRLPWQAYADKVTVTDAEIAGYYEAHKAELLNPAMVDLQYVAVSPETLEVPEVTDDELKLAYDSYLKEKNLALRSLAQILLTGDDASSKAAAVTQALAKGEDFAALAKQYSDDPSGKTGGDIGSYNPAVFGADAAKVDAALAGLGVGETSQAVETAFGTHIFKVTAMADAPSLESLKEALLPMVVAQKRAQAYSDQVALINNKVADGLGVQDIADELKLPLKRLDNYPQTDNHSEINQPMVLRAAFDDEIIQNQAVSGSIDLGDKIIWVQPSNYRAVSPMTLDDAKAVIKARLLMQKASALALDDAKAQAATISKADLSQLQALGVIGRQSPLINKKERASLFTTPAAGDDIAVWTVETDEGASLFVGGAIETQAHSQIGDEEKKAAAMMMKDIVGQDHLEDYLQYLRGVHEIEINDEALRGI